MLFILDKSHEVVGSLNSNGDLSRITTYFDDKYVQDLGTGAETFEFSTVADTEQAQHLVAGNFVAFKEDGEFKLFHIIQIEETHDDTFIKTCYCEMAGIELINEIIRPMKVLNSSLRKFLTTILEGTEWQLGRLDAGFTQVHDFEVTDYKSVYELIQEHAVGTYGAEISYRVEIEHGRIVGKYIDCYMQRGNENGFRFAYGSNLTSVTKTVDMSNLATALIGVGNNGITFKEVDTPDKPLNSDFIANETAYKQWNINGSHIFGIHKEDTDSPQELLRLTRLALEERANPKIKYEMKVELLGREVKIGDTVHIVDHEFNPPLYLSARVNQLTKSKTDPHNDEVVLANFKELNSNITEEMRALASQLEGYINAQFPIGGDKIQDDAIGGNHIQSNAIQGTHITANSITANKIQANSIETEHLSADSVTAEKIQAGSIETKHLSADSITSDKIQAGQITGNHIQANTITGDNIQGDTITGNHIASGSITAGSGIIADGAIGSAQISSLDAEKISAGTVDTSKVDIAGAGGNLLIRGNRLQVFEGHGNSKKERVSLGDVNNDGSVYGLRVRGADGETILLDENGITSEGITDGSIKNEHISGETQIDGYKLNINSVIREVNNATETISGTKININGTNLSTELSKISSTQDEYGKKIEANKSSIDANEKNIALKVDSQTYKTDKEGLESSIQKNTSRIDILDNNIDLKVSESVAKVGIGANNYIKNSGEFSSTDFWEGNITLDNKEFNTNGEIINTTDIEIQPNETYVYSVTVKLPNDFVVTETNLLSYIALGGKDGTINS